MKRLIALWLVVVSMGLGGETGHAQDDEPLGRMIGERLGEESCAEELVFRDYVLADPGIGALFAGEPVALTFVALDYLSARHAQESLDAVKRAIVDSFGEIYSADALSPPRVVSVGDIGDASMGGIVTIQIDDAESVNRISVVWIAVQQGPFVVVATAIGLEGSTIDLLGTVDTTLDRWPMSSEGSFRATYLNPDGQTVGGIWEAMPRIDDMPAGYTMAAEGFDFPLQLDC